MKNKLFLAIFVVLGAANASKIPSYITPCSKSDPNLNACATASNNKAYPIIINGDKKMNVQDFNPLLIEDVDIQANANLRLQFKNLTAKGFENGVPQGLSIDLDKNQWDSRLFLSRLEFVATYDIQGKILILPISGNGPANITFVDTDFRIQIQLGTEEKQGVKYFTVKNSVITYVTKRMFIHLENLFNGDERLGTEMNIFLNENWVDVEKEIYPALAETFNAVVSRVYIGVFAAIPADELFLP